MLAKVRTIGRMYAIYKKLRQAREKGMKYHQLITRSNPVKLNAAVDIGDISSFEDSKNIDLPNEARPPQKNIIITKRSTSIPSLKRKISLEHLLKETIQDRVIPTINELSEEDKLT